MKNIFTPFAQIGLIVHPYGAFDQLINAVALNDQVSWLYQITRKSLFKSSYLLSTLSPFRLLITLKELFG